MPKRSRSYKPRRRRPRYGGKRRKTFRKGGYRSRSSARTVGRYTSIIRPITLKPKYMMKRLQYYNTLKLEPGLIQTGSAAEIVQSNVPLWFTLRLNSPYPWQDIAGLGVQTGSGITQYTGSHQFNTPQGPLSQDGAINSATSYEGWSGPGSPAYSYSQWCIMGTKVTVSFTPIGNTTTSHSTKGAQPTAFFGFMTSGPNSGLVQNPRNTGTVTPGTVRSTVEDIYKRPYCKVRKILPTTSLGPTGAVGYKGGATSAAMSFNYSPKRMNGVKDISDNMQLWGQTAYSQSGDNAGTPVIHEPSEGDYLHVGILPMVNDIPTGFNNADDPAPMQAGIIQIKMETVIGFREPVDGAAKGSIFARGNTASASGGDAGAGSQFAHMAGAFARGAAGF